MPSCRRPSIHYLSYTHAWFFITFLFYPEKHVAKSYHRGASDVGHLADASGFQKEVPLFPGRGELGAQEALQTPP